VASTSGLRHDARGLGIAPCRYEIYLEFVAEYNSSIAGDSSPIPSMFDRITSNPDVLDGRPTIRGLRLTVRRVVEALALYPNRAELREEYPELDDEDIRQALAFAAANLDDRVMELRPSA